MNGTFQTSNWNYYLGDGSITNTLSYTNTNIYNQSYAFCSNVNETLHNSATIRYAQTGYPQRIHERSSTLTNSVTNQLLYLLAVADGQYVQFITQDTLGNPIPNVSVTVERQFNETWITIGLDSSDNVGGTTFFLNFNYDHRMTFTHDDYVDQVLVIKPSQTVYTIQLSALVSDASLYNSSLEGITYWKSPASGTFLTPGNVYNFTFDIEANLSNLINYSLTIVDSDDNILNQTSGSTATGGNISFTFNATSNYSYLYTKYYIDIGAGLFQIDPSIFPITEVYMGNGSIMKWFIDLKNAETGIEDRFTSLFWFFFILFVATASFTKFTNAELSSPGICLPLILGVTWIASFAGYLTMNINPSPDALFINQYACALMITLLSGGYWLGIINKT